MEDMTGPSEGSGAGRIADYIKEHSVDEQARALLFSGFDRQSEKFSIQTDYDITLNRMLRYYPGQWHTSEYFEVYSAPEGTCPIHFELEVINISRGAILIVAPGIVHASPCYADDAIRNAWLYFDTAEDPESDGHVR